MVGGSGRIVGGWWVEAGQQVDGSWAEGWSTKACRNVSGAEYWWRLVDGRHGPVVGREGL